jgi:hypothetical protein
VANTTGLADARHVKEVQANYVGPANITFIDPADDPRKKTQ